MNTLKLSLANIKSKPLYSMLCIATLSLSFALLIGIHQLKNYFGHQIAQNLVGVDMVVGAKGSPLQLVLSSLLHLDSPTGNIHYHEYQEMKNHSMVKRVVPISLGDNYKSHRIVATNYDFLELYDAEFQEGRMFKNSMEVVLGSDVAKKNHLKIGDVFLSSHGLVENNIDVHDDEFNVVGILKPNNKIIDRLIISNLETAWDVHDHEDEPENHHVNEHKEHSENHAENHSEQDYDKEKEITAMLISFRTPSALLSMPRNINKNKNMQAALPKYELKKLYEYMGVGFNIIEWIAYAILLISGMIIFISLYKMIQEHVFDLALMRTYGASKFQLVMINFYEVMIVVFCSFLLGLIFSQLGLHSLEVINEQKILISLTFKDLLAVFAGSLLMILPSVLAAILPIMKMNISKILSHES